MESPKTEASPEAKLGNHHLPQISWA